MTLVILLILLILFIIISNTYLKWHPMYSLILACLGFGLLSGMSASTVIISMLTGFGSLLSSIGLIIVLGSILGVVLEKSGSVQTLGSWLSKRSSKSPSLAVSILGMVLGIPIFCDSGFIILINLVRSIGISSGIPFPVMSISLAGGLYTTHTLVPPTPGPVAAAGNLGITESLGTIILLGIIVSLPVVIIVNMYARYIGWKIPYVNEQIVEINEQKAPLIYTFTLLILPLVLIAVASLLSIFELNGLWVSVMLFLGHPVIALLLTTSLGFYFFRVNDSIKDWVEKGVFQSGPILILTGCGGALGAVLKASALTPLITEWVNKQSVSGISFLLLGFILSTFFKTAQGSSTSALVIVSSLVAPLAMAAGFTDTLSLALLVLAIGSGAMMVSHANDSFFWVISQFSGFDLKTGYKAFTIMTVIQGFVALFSILLLYIIMI